MGKEITTKSVTNRAKTMKTHVHRRNKTRKKIRKQKRKICNEKLKQVMRKATEKKSSNYRTVECALDRVFAFSVLFHEKFEKERVIYLHKWRHSYE